MTVKKKIKKILKELLGIRISRPSHGINVFEDIADFLPAMKVEVVFDIGANVGQSARRFLEEFPKSQIYCFEPVAESFHQLQDNLRHKNIHSFKLACSAVKGSGSMVLVGSSDVFFLLNMAKTESVSSDSMSNLEAVDVTTVDEFCADKRLPHINYLKIDTEGGDLDVLKGAKRMLHAQQIDIVQVEAGMNVRNKFHVSLEELKAFLEKSGYFLFGLYEQVRELPTKEPHLRRTNPVFISEAVIKANKK